MSISTETTLLLVEDRQSDAAFVEQMLVEHRGDFGVSDDPSIEIDAVEHVDSLSAGVERVTDGDIDIVLLDLGLPDSNGLETVSTMLEHTATVPVIVLTGQKGMGVEAIKRGAQDYLVKGRLNADLLVRTITYAIERARISEDLRDRNHQLELINQILRTDLRNDVSMIVGRTDQLRERIDGDDRATVDAILEASNHALELTDTAATVIDVIAERPTADLQPYNLRRVLTAELERFRTDTDAKLTLEWEPDECESVSVAGTPMLSAVFEKLLANAAGDADRTDVMITVTVECTNDRVSVSIADTGEEMSEARKRQLVDPIQSVTAQAGISADWYFVRTVLESVGGDLSIENNAPQGTVVTVSLDRISGD
ncbi:hybrid sensor histidine kinase/response regulator [Natronoglomus mannanivorans]|uniref:Hybrid sensor histidine kinase/response regulator n=1 Tax=Natronoglomus mannanivorans TaxID=2979990 RepID=A0AAP3E4X9_9EURY|nr:hybrid sensor histidine kinase/response regulator [Halobacteria archaeon AArc-xg1-1]